MRRWARTAHSLLQRNSYGVLVLAVEVISSTATLGYAILLTKQSRSKPSLGLPLAAPGARLPDNPAELKFNLRVLIPCYKEKVGGAHAQAFATRWLAAGVVR
jgi:hypothetical protein